MLKYLALEDATVQQYRYDPALLLATHPLPCEATLIHIKTRSKLGTLRLHCCCYSFDESHREMSNLPKAAKGTLYAYFTVRIWK